MPPWLEDGLTPLGVTDRLPQSAEMVVVGGGVVGAATAFFAARAGIEVVLLEKRPALATLTTAASTGAFRLQFDNEEEWHLVSESVELFLNFQEVTRQDEYDVNIKQQGYLWLTTSEARAKRQADLVDMQHRWGQTDIELLGGDEVRERWPYIGPDVIQGRFRAGDGFLDPKQLTLGLAAGSRATIVTGCNVHGFTASHGRLTAVETSSGNISTELAVIAAGPLSPHLVRSAGLDLQLETVPRHKVVMPDVPIVPTDAPMTIDDDTGAHWRPALRGAYLLFTDPTTPPVVPVEHVPPDHGVAFQLLAPRSPVAVARIAPFWQQVWDHSAAHWIVQSGLYTMTPDHRPLLGPTDLSGVWVNTGYSGHGIMGSAAGSRHLVDVLTGCLEGENTFAPDRQFIHRETDVL